MLKALKYNLILILTLMLACDSPEEAPSLPPAADDGIVSESFGMEYYFSDSARVKAKLNCKHVTQKMEGEDEEKLELVQYLQDGIKMEFLNSSGQVTSRLTANNGTYWEKSGLAELKGKVVATDRSGGKKLETEQLFWDEEKDVIYTEEFVRIEEPDKIITGHGFESNTQFTSYKIRKVKGTILLDDK